MMATDSTLTPGIIFSRVTASLIGGYAFLWGFTTLGIALLIAVGMVFEDAYHLVMMLAFLVFLVIFCWAFAAASIKQVWLVLAGGGAIMTAAAWFLSGALV